MLVPGFLGGLAIQFGEKILADQMVNAQWLKRLEGGRSGAVLLLLSNYMRESEVFLLMPGSVAVTAVSGTFDRQNTWKRLGRKFSSVQESEKKEHERCHSVEHSSTCFRFSRC